MRKTTILVTGAGGQIGTVLVAALRQKYGESQVIASDINPPDAHHGLFEVLDIMNRERLTALVNQYGITQVYHLVAILSAKGEANPLSTWNLNMNSLFNVLEVARTTAIDRVFFPSSIAVFGPDTPTHAPQDTLLNPTTVYGISKAAAENWCQYYFNKYQLDVRSLRYPGIIGHQSMPGGGTTDYAVEIFHAAVKGQSYNCFLKSDTCLPMIFMDDAVRATIELMDAPVSDLKIRTSYNLHGVSVTPADIAQDIQRYMPDFEVAYTPDFRQAIADSWPDSIDDTRAREGWGWQPRFDLNAITQEMLKNLKQKYNKNNIHHV